MSKSDSKSDIGCLEICLIGIAGIILVMFNAFVLYVVPLLLVILLTLVGHPGV